MSYDHAVAQLYALGHELAHATSAMFDLAHMRAVLESLGHPERHFSSVLIAGTNGKGSTAATLASILIAAGHRTGLYTSPHLVGINERIRINGEDISDPDFAAAHEQVEAAIAPLLAAGTLPWHPSFFEVLTAMAFLYFARVGVETAVLEVGMGGRLDATNVVEPLVSVITDIALDHQKFLGNTVREIAGEKAGIIRPGGAVVTLPQHPEANDVIGNTILERGTCVVSAAQYVPPLSPGAVAGNCKPESGNSYPLAVMGTQIRVETPLLGRHQLRNVALAIAAADELHRVGLRIGPKDIERGIRQTSWPGRFQIISGEPEIVLDVAHNPAGAWALRSALSQRYGEASAAPAGACPEPRAQRGGGGAVGWERRPLLFVFGAMRDKAIAEISEVLFPLADRVIATQADNPRSATPEEVRQLASRTGTDILIAPTVAESLALAQRLADPRTVIVVTGSTYIVGEAMRVLREFCPAP